MVKKIGIACLLLLMLLAGLSVFAYKQVQQDPQILENYLSKLLQRDVRIGELGQLSLGAETMLLVHSLSIANPDWTAEPYFLNISRARVHLDLASLWRSGPVVINDLELAGVELNLLQHEDLPPNWQFGDSAKDDDGSRPDALELPVLLEQARLTAGRVIYRAPDVEIQAQLAGQLRGGQGLAVDIAGQMQGEPVSFIGHTSREGAGLTLSGEGGIRGWQFRLDGKLADPLAFRGLDFHLEASGDLPPEAGESVAGIPLQLQVQVSGSGRRLQVSKGLLVSGSTELSVSGTLGNLATLSGMDLDLVLDSPDLKELFPLGVANQRPVQVALEGRLLSDGSALKLQKLSGRSGGIRLRGDASLPLGGGLENTQFALRARGDSSMELLGPWTDNTLADMPFELELDAQWQEPQLQLDKLELRLGKNKLDGKLALIQGEQGLALSGRLNLSGKRAYRTLAALGITAQLPDESYIVKTDLELAANGALELSNLDLQLGRTDLTGELSYSPGQPARLDASLHAARLDLRFLTDAFNRELAQSPDQNGGGHQFDSAEPLTRTQLQERMIPDTPIRMDWLANLEGQLDLLIDEVVARQDLTSSGEFSFTIAGGRLTSEKMQWQGGFSSGEAQLELWDLSPGAGISLQMQTHRLPFFWILTGNPGAEQQSDYRVTMTGEGATLRQLVGTLNGSIYLSGGGGKMNNQGLNLFFGDVFAEIFSRINPVSEKETYTNMECHAGGVTFTDGKAELSPGLVLRTDTIDVALGGTVDLNTEDLNVVLNTRARTGVGISASKALTPYLKLGGNFSHPRLGVNAKGVMVSGGAAVATGGLSILAEGMWDRWVATSVNPCKAIFEQQNQAESELKKLFGRP